jgi:hypothetical protein
MFGKSPQSPGATERRSAPRHPCNQDTHGRISDVLEECSAEAGPWDVSVKGISVLVGPHHNQGTRLVLELHNRVKDRALVTFVRVVHTLLVPSEQEMWLTGCSFQDAPLAAEELDAYI